MASPQVQHARAVEDQHRVGLSLGGVFDPAGQAESAVVTVHGAGQVQRQVGQSDGVTESPRA